MECTSSKPKTKSEIERGPDKPSALPVNPDGMPADLKQCPQWVCWRLERRDNKWTKIPTDPKTGRNAKSDDPDTWGTFGQALDRYRQCGLAGIGFVFSGGDDFGGVDLDQSIDPQTNTLRPEFAAVAADLDSYTEFSPSGTGVKVFLRGRLQRGRKKGPYEAYSQGRYFTVTGQHYPGTPTTVNNRQPELERFCRLAFGGENHERKRGAGATTANGQARPTGLADADLIDKAGRAKNGDKFRRLWEGCQDGYPSHSEADKALCGLLAFWVGPDPERIDALFRQSGLYRAKWDREDYRVRTIQAALKDRTEYYGGTRNGQPAGGRGDGLRGDTGAGLTGPIHLTDVGNARRLVQRCGQDLRHCHPWRKWCVWDGRRWQQDAVATVTLLAKETVAVLYRTAADEIASLATRQEEVIDAGE